MKHSTLSSSPNSGNTFVSGSIILTQIKFRERMLMHTKSHFFKPNIAVEITHEKIIFSQVGELFSGETLKITHSKKDDRFTASLKLDCPNGEYFFDEEESTPDMVVVYYR